MILLLIEMLNSVRWLNLIGGRVWLMWGGGAWNWGVGCLLGKIRKKDVPLVIESGDTSP